MGLDKEQMKLLEETYKDFVRGGANLSAEDQAKLRELNSKISMLQLTFGQNMLKETNAFKLVIDKQEDLSGLPETLIANAAQAAKDAGMEGKWVFTLQNPSVMPFLQYSDKRELREKMFNAYINRGNNNNENDCQSDGHDHRYDHGENRNHCRGGLFTNRSGYVTQTTGGSVYGWSHRQSFYGVYPA